MQRVRCAVLSCLRSMAADPGSGTSVAGSSGGGAEVLAPQAGAMLTVVTEWVGDKQAAVVREQATQVGGWVGGWGCWHAAGAWGAEVDRPWKSQDGRASSSGQVDCAAPVVAS